MRRRAEKLASRISSGRSDERESVPKGAEGNPHSRPEGAMGQGQNGSAAAVRQEICEETISKMNLIGLNSALACIF